MNWKFWTWGRKPGVSTISMETLMKVREALLEKNRTSKRCPCSEEASIQCKCIGCPIVETCGVEKDCYIATRKSPYPCFVLVCSHRKELLGEKDREKEAEKFTGGESILGTVSGLPADLRGESTNGRIRKSSMVPADGKSSTRLDPIGEN